MIIQNLAINMEQEQIVNLINGILDPKLQELKGEFSDFRRWYPLDSVTDQFSPITGASQKIGFFGTSKVTKPTITGSRGGNVALTSLLTGLSTLGLIKDSTT